MDDIHLDFIFKYNSINLIKYKIIPIFYNRFHNHFFLGGGGGATFPLGGGGGGVLVAPGFGGGGGGVLVAPGFAGGDLGAGVDFDAGALLSAFGALLGSAFLAGLVAGLVSVLAGSGVD